MEEEENYQKDSRNHTSSMTRHEASMRTGWNANGTKHFGTGDILK